jgi:uncharacterized membrane protein YhaH (DUF805 family)
MRWLVMPFRRYADFKGRSGRTEFWTFFGLSVAAFLVTVVATGLLTDVSTATQPKAPGANASPAGVIGYMLWWLASIVPWFAAQIRRFHDQGRSGRLCLIGVGGYVAVGFGAMPVAGILFLAAMALMALPGEETENRFGPPVNAANDWETAPIELDPSPDDSQGETPALDFDDALTFVEPHSEATEPQQELPVVVPLLTTKANSLGSQSSEWSAPAASDTMKSEPQSGSLSPLGLPDGISLAADGRYLCGGYFFRSLDQAASFAKRKNDRGGNSERSVSPFSFAPIPRPPQPTPPKAERSGFFGFVSSAKKQTVAEHWVATPTNLSAGGVPFEGHLVYFGTRPRNQQYEQHRSLIDPNLDVSNGRDPQGATFSYWPNYSELRPEARRSYLEWLSSGRSNPNTPIGYVFIYFYGLERRLVKDRAEDDAPAIISELRRLLAIYGDNHSFKNYCSALLDMGELLFGNVDETPTPTLDNRYSWELPIRLRVYLGKKVAAGQALDSNDALCWTLGHPLLYPRTPVTRCFSEFCELWKVRFGEQFPKGLSVREPKSRLNFQYRSASSEFSATTTVDNLQ